MIWAWHSLAPTCLYQFYYVLSNSITLCPVILYFVQFYYILSSSVIFIFILYWNIVKQYILFGWFSLQSQNKNSFTSSFIVLPVFYIYIQFHHPQIRSTLRHTKCGILNLKESGLTDDCLLDYSVLLIIPAPNTQSAGGRYYTVLLTTQWTQNNWTTGQGTKDCVQFVFWLKLSL